MTSGRSKKPAATIARVTNESSRGEPRGERRGRNVVDSGEEEFDRWLRQGFVMAFRRWCKTAVEAKAIPKMPSDKERADVIEDLVAMWACPVETTLDAAVETFMSTAVDEGEEADCPECKTTLEIPENFEDGMLLQCSNCNCEFDPDEDDDTPDPDGGEPMVIDAEIVVEPEPVTARATARRRA